MDWDKDPVWMNKVSDGVYQVKVTTEKDKNYFKFYEGSKWVETGTGMSSTKVSWVARRMVAKMLLVQSIILATAGVLHSQWLSLVLVHGL